MIIVITLDLPVLIPNQITIRRGARFAVVTAIDSFPITEFLRVDIRKREVRHVQFAELRLLLGLALTIAQPEAKKSDLVTVAFATFAFEMSGVVPPFGFDVWMRVMILGKTNLAAGQSQLISEAGTNSKQTNQHSARTSG